MKKIEIVLSTGKVITRECKDWSLSGDDNTIELELEDGRTMYINSESWISVEDLR